MPSHLKIGKRVTKMQLLNIKCQRTLYQFWSRTKKNLDSTVAMIQQKALTFAKELNVENSQASDGWLQCWKQRNYITFQDCISGIEIRYARNC